MDWNNIMKTLELVVKAQTEHYINNGTYYFYDSTSTKFVDYNTNFNADELFRLITILKRDGFLFDYYKDLNGNVLHDSRFYNRLSHAAVKMIVNDMIQRIYVEFQYQTFEHAIVELISSITSCNDNITFNLTVKGN